MVKQRHCQNAEKTKFIPFLVDKRFAHGYKSAIEAIPDDSDRQANREVLTAWGTIFPTVIEVAFRVKKSKLMLATPGP